MFLASKQDAFDAFVVLAKKVQNERDLKITAIRTDHGGEFENHSFSELCEQNGIEHNFSAPRTPQQNGVVERKNRVLTEMARSMLNEKEVSQVLWADAMSTACYISNRAMFARAWTKPPMSCTKAESPTSATLESLDQNVMCITMEK